MILFIEVSDDTSTSAMDINKDIFFDIGVDDAINIGFKMGIMIISGGFKHIPGAVEVVCIGVGEEFFEDAMPMTAITCGKEEGITAMFLCIIV